MTYSKNDSSTYIFCYIGAFLFIGASLAGVAALMPDLQLAMSMRDKPDSMSLSYFIENGPNDNAFVRLTDVEVDLDNSYEIISTTRRRGFKTSRSSGVIANLYPLNLVRTSPIIAMRAPHSYEEAWEKAVTQGIVEGRILPKMVSDSLDRMKSHINSHNESSVRWTIEPLKRRPELKQARLNLLYALLIGALGLAIANLGESSGGTLASVVSYLGAPLRVRPFNMVWPGVYVVAGVALLGSSYETIFDYGKLGNIYFNGLMLSLGYMMAQVGLGAIVSAVLVPGVYYLFDESQSSKPKLAAEIQVLESTPPKLPVPSARLPYTAAQFRSPDYRDPVVLRDAAITPATSGVILQTDCLPAEILGPKVREFQTCDDAGESSCQLYLGCAVSGDDGAACSRRDCRSADILAAWRWIDDRYNTCWEYTCRAGATRFNRSSADC